MMEELKQDENLGNSDYWYSPHTTTGEILYRSGFYGSSLEEELNTSLEPFKEFLNANQQILDAKRRHDMIEHDLKVAHETLKSQIGFKKAFLKSLTLNRIDHKVNMILEKAKISQSLIEAKEFDRLQALDRKIISLCSVYAAITEKENIRNKTRVERFERKCEQQIANVKASLELCEFALHLERETGGKITLKKLEIDHPQYIRCKRAASENVKHDFFKEKFRFSGISVVDVFKIENKPLLKEFQKHSQSLNTKPGTGAVKGLFCTVPAESLERVIVCGMHSTKTLPESIRSCFKGRIFRRKLENLSSSPDEDSPKPAGVGSAEHIIFNTSSLPEFPRTFSRFSTLESERAYVGSQSSLNPEAFGDSKTRYLALSRVIVGNIFVTNSQYNGFPDVTDTSALLMSDEYDSVFNPNEEEYLMVNPRFILPEFIIAYRYSSRDNVDDQFLLNQNILKTKMSKSPDLKTGTANQTIFNDSVSVNQEKEQILPIDLSSSNCPGISALFEPTEVNENKGKGKEFFPSFGFCTPQQSKQYIIPDYEKLDEEINHFTQVRKKNNDKAHQNELEAGYKICHANATRQREAIVSYLRRCTDFGKI